MAENFKDAVVKSIRSFYSGSLPEKAIEASEKEFIYTLEYFDQMDEGKEKAKAEKKVKEAKDEASDA